MGTAEPPYKRLFSLVLKTKRKKFKIVLDTHGEYTYYPLVPSNRAYSMLRFRTKKQKAEFTKAAKEQYYSLNEYILRILEEKHRPNEQTVEQTTQN